MGGFSHPKKWKNPPGLEKSTQKVEKNLLILTVLVFIQHIGAFVERQQMNWIKRCIKSDDSAYIKKLTFAEYFKNESKKRGKLSTTYGQVLQNFKNKGLNEEQMIKRGVGNKSTFKKFFDR